MMTDVKCYKEHMLFSSIVILNTVIVNSVLNTKVVVFP